MRSNSITVFSPSLLTNAEHSACSEFQKILQMCDRRVWEIASCMKYLPNREVFPMRLIPDAITFRYERFTSIEETFTLILYYVHSKLSSTSP